MAEPTPQVNWARWAKVAWKAKDAIISGVGWLLFEDIRDIQQAPSDEGGTPAETWSLFRYRWENTQSSDNADDQYMDWEIVNHTAGEVDVTWTEQDYIDVNERLELLVSDLSAYVASYLHCTRVDVYSRAFAPIGTVNEKGRPKHFVDSGPPVWSKTMLHAGGGSATAAPQICTTITEEVPDRIHWGRIYLPTIGSNWITNSGRMAEGACTAIVASCENYFASLHDAEFQPVVVSTQANRKTSHVLMNITGLRCDDVLDVQRRRRYQHSHFIARVPQPGAALLPAAA